MNSIYASWRLQGPSEVWATAPWASGTVILHSFDPSGHLDGSLVDVHLPPTNSVPGDYPNAPAMIVIPSAEIVR